MAAEQNAADREWEGLSNEQWTCGKMILDLLEWTNDKVKTKLNRWVATAVTWAPCLFEIAGETKKYYKNNWIVCKPIRRIHSAQLMRERGTLTHLWPVHAKFQNDRMKWFLCMANDASLHAFPSSHIVTQFKNHFEQFEIRHSPVVHQPSRIALFYCVCIGKRI